MLISSCYSSLLHSFLKKECRVEFLHSSAGFRDRNPSERMTGSESGLKKPRKKAIPKKSNLTISIAKKMPGPEGLAHMHNNTLILCTLIQEDCLHTHPDRGEIVPRKFDINGEKKATKDIR